MAATFLMLCGSLNAAPPLGPPSPLCDQSDCTEPWVPVGPGFTEFEFGADCKLKVIFKVRFCTPIQIWVESITVISGSNCNNLSAKTLRELAVLTILEGFNGPNSVPPCTAPDQPYEVFTAACIYEASCTYTFADDPTDVDCDPPSIQPNNATTRREITETSHIPCGETCCRTIYTVCREPDSDIVQVTKGATTQYGECSAKPQGAQNECYNYCGG